MLRSCACNLIYMIFITVCIYFIFLYILQMSEGKRVLIILPDERRLELLVQPNLLSSDLLDLVTSQVGLKEKEFFGLAFVDET